MLSVSKIVAAMLSAKEWAGGATGAVQKGALSNVDTCMRQIQRHTGQAPFVNARLLLSPGGLPGKASTGLAAAESLEVRAELSKGHLFYPCIDGVVNSGRDATGRGNKCDMADRDGLINELEQHLAAFQSFCRSHMLVLQSSEVGRDLWLARKVSSLLSFKHW